MQRAISLNIPLDGGIIETVRQYNAISNLHIKKCFELKTDSKTRLHKALYHSIRKEFPRFPSALVQCARDNAVEMIRSNGYKKHTKKRPDSSIRFDLRTAKVFLESGQLQLTTVDGRKKYGLKIPSYFSKYFDWKVKAVMIGIGGGFARLRVIVEGVEPAAQIGSKDVLGIDLGINNFAVLSNGTFIKPTKIRMVKRRYAYLRKKLQSRGTRSAKRHLKRIGGRERRFMRDFNHRLSKWVAGLPYVAFALEDLRGIRKGNKGSTLNKAMGSWAYYQFGQLLTYKAEDRGKSVVLVDPRYTSQRCCRCGFTNKSNRKKGFFHCNSCGFSGSADLNASKNISQIGAISFGQAVVNQPIVTTNEGTPSLSKLPEVSYKLSLSREGS